MNEMAGTLKGAALSMLAAYAQQYVDRRWQDVWDAHLPDIERMFAKGGDSAYGFFCLKLFHPLTEEMVEAGFLSEPVLPGLFPQSEEHWGPWEDRERRFWSVIRHGDGSPLGTLVTRIYHDHTRLRLPRPPRISAIGETDPVRLSSIIRMDAIEGKVDDHV
ncbi:DUF6022 family protein [Cohnella sp. REN36]|uniref:DUF6022 family protein n=1 Tax=Cohnella sp. REN36 TaxID=2887347 RepID=UPI001D13FBFA|nr:DUF6022 family protein [Cohnella sp. REN36]MCC3373873.1 DUF6022 family protein [Cohnella sp. REN36]